MLTCAALMFAASQAAFAQAAMRAVPNREQWYLDTGESTYMVGVDERHMVESLYWPAS